MQSVDHNLQVQSQSEGSDGRVYVNLLNDNSKAYISLVLVAVHRYTNQEKLIDALMPNDSLATALFVVRQALGPEWSLLESWEIEPFDLMETAA